MKSDASTASDSMRQVEKEQEDSLPPSDTAAFLTATGTSGGGARVAMARRPTPMLDHPIESMNVVQLLLYLNRLAYEDGPGHAMETERACKKKGTNQDCDTGKTTRVLIQPEFGNTLIDTSTIDANGVVVARFINRGDHDEARYRITRGKAWWLVVRKGGELRSQIFERTWNPLKAARVVSEHPFRDCGHTEVSTVAKAHWHGCERATTGSKALSTPGAPYQLVSRAMQEATRTLRAASWVTCPLGCCIAGDLPSPLDSVSRTEGHVEVSPRIAVAQ